MVFVGPAPVLSGFGLDDINAWQTEKWRTHLQNGALSGPGC
jgi:hypothetical protein